MIGARKPCVRNAKLALPHDYADSCLEGNHVFADRDKMKTIAGHFGVPNA